jgi:hypothetical protein
MVVSHFFVLRANVGDLAQIERKPQRVEGWPPQLSIRKCASENR